MRSVYIAGPLSAETEEKRRKNVHAAAALTLKYLKEGWAVYCPHLQTDYIDLHFEHGFDYEKWFEADFYWLSKCDLVAFLPDWETSKGARMEMVLAKALGKEVVVEE